MNIIISYCTVWNYLPRASRAEEEIKEVFSDAQVTLVAGDRGAFDVSCDGKLIFSKLLKVGTYIQRFPDAGELVGLIKEKGYKQTKSF